jgi:hypothetical protein
VEVTCRVKGAARADLESQHHLQIKFESATASEKQGSQPFILRATYFSVVAQRFRLPVLLHRLPQKLTAVALSTTFFSQQGLFSGAQQPCLPPHCAVVKEETTSWLAVPLHAWLLAAQHHTTVLRHQCRAASKERCTANCTGEHLSSFVTAHLPAAAQAAAQLPAHAL